MCALVTIHAHRMGIAPSKGFEDFDLGRYWIGLDVTAARKGLLLHFKDRSVLTLSQQNIIDLLDQSHNKDRITIVYNPTNMKTTRVIIG